jgi:hypothetical protein
MNDPPIATAVLCRSGKNNACQQSNQHDKPHSQARFAHVVSPHHQGRFLRFRHLALVASEPEGYACKDERPLARPKSPSLQPGAGMGVIRGNKKKARQRLGVPTGLIDYEECAAATMLLRPARWASCIICVTAPRYQIHAQTPPRPA